MCQVFTEHSAMSYGDFFFLSIVFDLKDFIATSGRVEPQAEAVKTDR